MKKYIKPEMEIVDIVIDNILAALSSAKDALPVGDTPDNNFAKSHDFSVWDEDNDE